IEGQASRRSRRGLEDHFAAKDLSDPEFLVVAFALLEHSLQDDVAFVASRQPHENHRRSLYVPALTISVEDRTQLGQREIRNRRGRMDDYSDVWRASGRRRSKCYCCQSTT